MTARCRHFRTIRHRGNGSQTISPDHRRHHTPAERGDVGHVRRGEVESPGVFGAGQAAVPDDEGSGRQGSRHLPKGRDLLPKSDRGRRSASPGRAGPIRSRSKSLRNKSRVARSGRWCSADPAAVADQSTASISHGNRPGRKATTVAELIDGKRRSGACSGFCRCGGGRSRLESSR